MRYGDNNYLITNYGLRMDKKLQIIFAYLKELFPHPETELNYSTPFQLVVAVMLSAQATDIQVNKVTDKLFKKIKDPEDLLAMGFANFERSISSINYYRTKAKHIWETAKLLPLITSPQPSPKIGEDEKHQLIYKIPEDLEELMKFPGIGVKTAKLVLHELYGQAFIAVDTHIHRVSNRL